MKKTYTMSTRDWMLAAFLVAVALVVTIYAAGDRSHRLGIALRSTARWSLLWFCLSSYGGALTTLFGARFLPLARRGRDFGLAFASAHTVHVALVAWLLYSSPPPPLMYLIVFSIGVVCIYVLAVISLSSRLSLRLGRRRWNFVRTVGVEYIAFAYTFEFANRILDGDRANALHYLPLLAASVGGPALRVAAAVKRRSDATNVARTLAS